MLGLLVHPQTARQTGQFLEHPTHAVALIGPVGSGKDSMARRLAAQLLGLDDTGLDGYPHFKTVLPDTGKTAIGIEAVRDLQHFTKLKLVSDRSVARVIYISDAHQLTAEAQNALLKLLEEPPAGTIFLLAATSERQLLPTIRSRCQMIAVQRPGREETEAYFAERGYRSQDISANYALSGGLPGLMAALLDDSEHPLKQTVQLARQLLQMTQFERLCKVEPLAKDKAGSLQLLFVLRRMAQAAIEQSATRAAASGAPADKAIRQWRKVAQACYDAEQAFNVSAQSKLTLTRFMLSI